ncbi:hypothetical protein DFP73DRAFT_315775 [Morchella snyderi]|nr:hypothetical protein DFP73DRAFT_315775 [Morchella snyderi]
MKIKNTSIRSGWDKISAYEAINEDGENNLTYGREIVVRQLTPNVAIALLISSAYSGLKLEYVEPLDSLLNAMTIALSPEPHSLQDFVGYMNHDTFAFNAVFFELFDEDNPNQRKATVSASKSYGGKKFGSQWEGVFAPKNINRHSKPKMTSIGEYSDDKAFGKPRNVKDVEKYTAPEEVFLDKLARVIDWAVDDGMWKVLDQLEMELGDRADALFFTEENEKLLFDDHQFSRTKRYHWALQWLKKMSDGINEFVTAIEEFEKISLPNLRRNAQAHRIRSRVRMAKAELSSEKVFERKVERAKKLRAKIEAKYSEIKDFRDALVSASGVLESRAAVSQAESMHTLTVLMIIFLPLTVVIALYSMPFMPETYQTLSAFGVTMGLVIMTTLILGLNLGSIILLFANKSQRFGTYLQSSMLVVGDSWAEKGKLLQDTDEAENLVRRGKRVPAELWYTWYCVVWIFFLLPATELYKIGGLRCLMNTGYVKMTASSQSNPPNYSEPLWAIAIIPLRIALLPVHFLTIVADYFLLMIFSKTLLGWDCSSGGFMPARAKPMSSRQGTIKGDVDLDEKTIPPWKQRLWDPIAILKEIPTRGIGRYRQPEDQIQNRSTSMDYSGNEEHTYSSMDLLLKDIVKNEKDIGSRTSTFSGSGTAFGGIKRSGPVEIVFSSSDVPDMNVGIRSGLISPTQSGRPLQSTSDAEQDPYTLPPILPESATSPALPIMSALSSNSSWELPHLKIVGRTMSRNREQEVDPERGEMQTFIIPE